jgi:general secretion pathway protein G
MKMTKLLDRYKTCRTKAEHGFTLVELLVVLVILVLLASVIGPRVISYLGSSRSKTSQIQIESLTTALELFHIDVGRYPTATEGLESLVKVAGTIPGWNGPYLRKNDVPVDPWGKPYVYASPGKEKAFDLMTLGRDGKEGGTGEDADIRN